MQSEPQLPSTATHSGLEAKGTILGLEGRSVVPVLGAAIASILLLVLNMSGSAETLALRIGFALMPVVLTTGYILVFVHRKPPHYARDAAFGLRARLQEIGPLPPGEGLGFNADPSRRRRGNAQLFN